MTRHALLRANVLKEIRALLPACLAAAAVSGATAVLHDRRFASLMVVAYWVGAAAVGAQSIGQEYTHRMLGVILAQPVDRRRLLAIKLGVLTALLLALTAFTWAVMPLNVEIFRNSIWHRTSTVIIAALCALFLAPPLTMASRNPLAGIIFSLTIPMCLLIGGELTAFVVYGPNAGTEIDRLKLAVFWTGMSAICAAGAFVTWRMFVRLEAIDGRGREIHLPRWLRPDAAVAPHDEALRRRRHPMWLLVKKEVRLQQMIFVIVGLYFLLWATEGLVRRIVPDFPLPPAALLAMLYFNLLAIVIGSLASAEERQFGTLESQLLVPAPVWQQWAVKAGTALALALVLGIGVPLSLQYIGSLKHVHGRELREMVLAVVLMTSFGLYLSSLCASGVRALVCALAFVVGATAVYQYGEAWASRAAMHLLPGPRYIGPGRGAGLFAVWDFLSFLMAAGLTALLLRFGFVNHRSAERNRMRTAWQLTWVAGFGAWMIILRVAAFTYYRLMPTS